MTARRWWWLSIGLVVTLWQVSSGVRALMGALDRIYETEDRRPFLVRFATSVWLAAAICAGLAIAGLVLFVLRDPGGPPALRILVALGRWAVLAAILMGIIVALLAFLVGADVDALLVNAQGRRQSLRRRVRPSSA